MRVCVCLFFLVVAPGCNHQGILYAQYVVENTDSKSMMLINGNWYNGRVFQQKTVWVKNGLLHFSSLKSVDTIVDLNSGFVIPPFAEAHNHNLESAYKLEERITSYLENGVFYVKLLSSIKKRIAPLMHHYNRPDGLDIQMAHAPLTGSGGHPIALRKRFYQMGHFQGVFGTFEEIESNGYFVIDSPVDLQSKWADILSYKPDFIKIMLLHSEDYELRKNDTTYFGKKGLNPKIVPEIVNRAHMANLRVSAHVATSHDFHVALKSGVDEIAHLPEIHNGKPITVQDAILAKNKGATIVTTASLVKKNYEKENYKSLVQNVKNNLTLIKESEVTLAIGSDMYNDNSVGEFKFLYDLNVFSNQELLKMWTENATKAIFPNRKIGKLQDGYEASFLVLDKNPIQDISDINTRIRLRIKQGLILD